MIDFRVPMGGSFDRRFLTEHLERIDADERRIGEVIAGNSVLAESDIANLFTQMHTRDSSFAVLNGLAHEVREAHVPEGAPTFHIAV